MLSLIFLYVHIKSELKNTNVMKQAIICVDDEEIILEALKGQLAPLFENQFGIEVAQSSTDALDIYDELIADGYEVPVVISDYLMPGMRGDEFLIKIHEKNPDTLKILLTGHANIEGITNAINKANLYRFIPKPWDRDDLILTVREAIRSFLQERKIKENNDELQAINDNLEKLVIDRTYELEMANVTKDIFISIISHDLKNSFNGILGFSDVLLKDFNDFNDEQKISMLTNINQLSDQTYKLLENMLQWALMQRGGIKFNPTEFILSECVQEEYEMLQQLAKQKELKMELIFDKEIKVSADKNMISTVIRNIISNAIKFTYPNGNINVSITSDDKFAKISVKDNGTGISDENQKKIFNIPGAFKTYGTNHEEGTGLGLILCKEFVTRNRGEIFVDSKLGEGTTISFTVPVLPI